MQALSKTPGRSHRSMSGWLYEAFRAFLMVGSLLRHLARDARLIGQVFHLIPGMI